MPTLATAPLPAVTLMTADEFWEFSHRPENEYRNLDLIRGVVVEMSRPSRIHGVVSNNIAFAVTTWARNGQPGYIATGDAGVILGKKPDTVVGPDVAYYTDATTPDEVPEKWGDVAPVLAVEVQSPNDRPGAINRKVREYLDAGTLVVWQIDPDERTVTIHKPTQAFIILKATDTLSGDPELPGFSVLVGEFFRLPGEPASQPLAAP